MEGAVTTPLLMVNTVDLNNTSLQGVDDQISYASAYLGNDVTRVLWLIVPPVLLMLGCYGNVMIVVVMRGLRDSDSTACLSVYFTALAVSDLFMITSSVIFRWPMFAFGIPFIYYHDLSFTTLIFVSYVSSLTSAWFLVAMTCQRLTSVILPHRVALLCTVRRGKIITATIVTVGCLANIHLFIHYHVEYYEEEGYGLYVSNDRIAANIFTYLELCLASLIPFLFLIVANCVLIYRTLQSMQMARKMTVSDKHQTASRSAKVSSMTVTLIMTSFAFLVLTLPSYVLAIYFDTIGYYDGDIVDAQLTDTLALVDTVCLLLWMSNSAVNFYIYILSGRKFRQETKRYVCPCLKQQ